MNSKEWRNWIDGVERIGTVGLGPMRELLADLEAAERRAEALEAECGRLRTVDFAARDLISADNATEYERASIRLEEVLDRCAALAPQAGEQDAGVLLEQGMDALQERRAGAGEQAQGREP